MIISCPSCDKQLRVPDDLVGQDRVVKCPGCADLIKLADLATTTKPTARPAPVTKEPVDRLDEEDDEPRGKTRPSSRRDRNEEEDDQPRDRRKRDRDEDDDENSDRPARRKTSRTKQKSGSNTGLIIGLVAGTVALLLLIGCGIGGYLIYAGAKGGLAAAGLVDNPAVADANYEKVELNMALPNVEAIFGPGALSSDADARAILVPAGGARQARHERHHHGDRQRSKVLWPDELVSLEERPDHPADRRGRRQQGPRRRSLHRHRQQQLAEVEGQCRRAGRRTPRQAAPVITETGKPSFVNR